MRINWPAGIRDILLMMAVLIAACWIFVSVIGKSVMPSAEELAELDSLVAEHVGPDCTVERSTRNYSLEQTEGKLSGFFAYRVHCQSSTQNLLAHFKLENGHLELTSLGSPKR
jgi:hypothetical protein